MVRREISRSLELRRLATIAALQERKVDVLAPVTDPVVVLLGER